MKKLGLFAVLLSTFMFTAGCSQQTVEETKDAGEATAEAAKDAAGDAAGAVEEGAGEVKDMVEGDKPAESAE